LCRKGAALEKVRARASAFTFFGVKIPAAHFEENIHRKVAKVEEGSQKRSFVPEIIRHGG
jgi:hypothetical protein